MPRPSIYMDWADRFGISYLAWTWDAWGQCSVLITNFAGSPTSFGNAVRTHYTARAATVVPPTTRLCQPSGCAFPAGASGRPATASSVQPQITTAPAAPTPSAAAPVIVALVRPSLGVARDAGAAALMSGGVTGKRPAVPRTGASPIEWAANAIAVVGTAGLFVVALVHARRRSLRPGDAPAPRA